MRNLLFALLIVAAFFFGLATESCKKGTITPNKAFKPSLQDSARMVALEQEILLCAMELGVLISRTTGCKNCSSIEGFEMKIGNTAAGGPKSDVVILNYGNGVFECHKDPPGICCECPCP